MAVLVDTGVSCRPRTPTNPGTLRAQLLRAHRGELVVAAPVVPETAWLIESRLGPAAEVRFLRLVTSGELHIVDLTLTAYQRCIDLIEAYADLGLGLVDASLVATAETRGITTIATLNTRDFHVVRLAHTDAFTLLP